MVERDEGPSTSDAAEKGLAFWTGRRRPRLYVVMRELRWEVLREGLLPPVSTHDEKDDAVTMARALSSQEGCSLVVFDLGGRPVAEGP
jgi:hypothetical protein